MARPASIAAMSVAPNAAPTGLLKDGTSKGRQVYYCGDYGRRTTPDAACQRPSARPQGARPGDVPGGQLVDAIARIFGVSVQAFGK